MNPPSSFEERLRLESSVGWSQSRPLRFFFAYSAFGGFWVTLALVGYPAWRVVVGLGVVAVLMTLLWRAFSGRAARHDGDLGLGCAFSSMAVSGGVHSPWLVFCFTMGTWYVMGRGWNRTSQLRIYGYGAALALLTVAPPSWVGPPVPEPLGRIWGVLLFILSFTIASDNVIYMFESLKKATAEMLRARDELASQALDRARELELLSSKLSHELKNPLGAIGALVQLSVRSSQDPAAVKRLGVVASEVQRMDAILHEYLSFSRPLSTLVPERVQLATLADDVLLALGGRALAAGVHTERRGEAVAFADPRRMKEALLNLVANALEATPSGGRVLVTLSVQVGQAWVAVSDTGRGMTAEVLSRLGTPFFTTRENGTGLGVLLARSVFTQHGGSLEYTSAPGEGTTARGQLPTGA